ncbi:OmpH family outer membrane protein [Polaribacter aestuariivivens]|uniref:OmpH family outer membrane protein n=1 Tax=Polaribacter aestuariivivens TaxID=2304626 RepID=A0A5S3NE70_9FLAO|nr:OmpH family outer membrane protein [Polaribacter aestuariivivens]TMM32139.1 OmpH family outer membrane protein [Polaribacter aestuariivivens]
MRKIFLSIVLLLTVSISWSQRNQIIAYIDMEYILENVPEYLEAQNTLDEKVVKWRKTLDKEARFIEVLKSDLANEKAILTKDLIEEKEEEIALKQDELRRLESLYFGPNGDMFLLRKQLVKPIQDQVYNAIQGIAARKKYDFVFDKSSELVMLYSNKKYDISDLVLATIDRTRLIDNKNAKREEKKNATKELTPQQKQALAKKEAAVEKQLSDREAKKKALEERRKELIRKREEKRELLRKKKEALRKKKEDQKKEQEKKDENNN